MSELYASVISFKIPKYTTPYHVDQHELLQMENNDIERNVNIIDRIRFDLSNNWLPNRKGCAYNLRDFDVFNVC